MGEINFCYVSISPYISTLFLFIYLFIFLSFAISLGPPAAYGGSHARGRIGAVAGLR